jgi:TetR/AcrR family transcriptional regulator, transcriptional repressor for nem operon
MSYEVTKTIRGRAYRYHVESVRDAETGKRRNRWTYIGRVEGVTTTPPERRRKSDARERLLSALERILATRDFAGITAGMIASEAGLAHGTFYRHFRDKRDVLLAAFDRVRERRTAPLDALSQRPASVDEARAVIRTFVEGILRWPSAHVSLLRAYVMLSLHDEEFARERRARRKLLTNQMADAFTELRLRGFTAMSDPNATATALYAMLDGIFREAIVDGEPLDDAWIAAAVDVFDRTIFGP